MVFCVNLRYFLPVSIRFTLYNTLVLPCISYCNIVFANSYSSTNALFLLQKKAMRICAGYRDHTDPTFYQHKLLKLQDINFLQTVQYSTSLYFKNMF